MNNQTSGMCVARLPFLFKVFCLLAILIAGGCASAYPQATPDRVSDVVQRISPAVVRVDIAQAIYRKGKQSLERGNGSGVIFDANGHILTNYHVAGRAVEIHVVLANRERVPAKLIGDDHWTDLAVLQMDMDVIRSKHIEFAWAPLGTSTSLQVGQDVMAFGTPFGLARTVTRGSVSNTDRTLSGGRGDMSIDGYETGDFSNWIQMDVPINPGNSGGPLVDLNGEVVGINTRGGAQQLNFAIPIDTAIPVITAILKTAGEGKKGRLDRSDLGLDLMPLHELESYFGLDINRGVEIGSVDKIGAANDAGLKPQDILLDINDVPTNVRFPEELAEVRHRIANFPVGSQIKLTVRRRITGTGTSGSDHGAGSFTTLTLFAKTALLEGFLGEEQGFKQWGVSVRQVTRPYANEDQLDDVRGVWITSKTDSGAIDKAEIEVGDVIRAVNNEPVTDLADFTKKYEKTLKNHDEKVLLDIQRKQQRRNAVLDVKKYAPTPDAGA